MKGLLYSFLLFLLLITSAHANQVKLGGSVKSYLIAGDHALVGDDGGQTNFSWFTFIRANALYAHNPQNNFELSYQLATQWGETETETTAVDSIAYRIDDLEPHPNLPVEDNVKVQQNLDRLMWNYRMRDIDFFIGRQAISFGSGRMTNPTDVFLPFPIGAINNEYRIGVDAFRFKVPAGMMGEFDAGIVFGEDGSGDKSAYFVNYFFPLKKIDTVATIINYRENWLTGLDVQGKVMGQAVWLEAAYNQMRNYQSEDQAYLRYVIGGEYRFSDILVGFVEYQYNGAGETQDSQYNSNANTLAYQEGGVFFLAQNYISTGISWEFNPLWNYSVSQINNMDDHSNFISQNLSWNLKESIYLEGIFYLSLGTVDSEFDRYSNLGMLLLRAYF